MAFFPLLYIFLPRTSLTDVCHVIRPGLTDRVHGISCARMAGLPDSVCEIAADKSKELEDNNQKADKERRSMQMQRILRFLTSTDPHPAAHIVQYARKALE